MESTTGTTPRAPTFRLAGANYDRPVFVGREGERAAIDALVEGALTGRGGVLVVRGEPGIGKSALLEHAEERAVGMRIVHAVGVEAESELAFSALHQLLRPLVEHLPALVEVHRRALEGALGLTYNRVDDRFLIGAATLSLLAEASEAQPLLCLIDDAHWLDGPSREALFFAARRLERDRVAIVVAERAEGPAGGGDLPELWVGSLPDEAARSLLSGRFGDTLVASVRERLVEAAAGNPLALTELASALTESQRRGYEAVPNPVLLPRGLEPVYRERFQALPGETRTLLLVAAAEGSGDQALVFRAGQAVGVDPGALGAAERAGLVRATGDRISFRHPLVRAAVYESASFAERQRVHRALADVLAAGDNADRRAWHLAAATVGTDEEVADLLERTADRARARGGFAAFFSAMERAGRLTERDGLRARRLVAAADGAFRAGESERALALLDEVGAPEDALVRATAAEVRGVIELRAGVPAAAVPLFLSAAEDAAPVDRHLALRLAMRAAEAAAVGSDLERVPDVLRWVTTLGDFERGEDRLIRSLLEGLAVLYQGEAAAGVAAFARAVEEADELDEPLALHWAATAMNYLGDSRRAEALYRGAVERARLTGEIYALPFSLVRLAAVEYAHGALAASEADATEGLRFARETGQESIGAYALAVLAHSAAMRGAENECAALAAEALEVAVPRRLFLTSTAARFALGELDLALGRSLRALERLEALFGSPDAHPLYRLFGTPTLVEAAARAGWPERARRRFTEYERWVRATETPLHLPLMARCHALLAGGDGSEEHYQEALRLHAAFPHALDRARTQLAYGELLRRAKRKSEARMHLRPALEAFEALGAAPWADRARGELRATGETARTRRDDTRGDLTPQELQVARLVAAGATNREAAAQLFLSPKTVEYHLHKVFTKLGLSSRMELARLDLERDEAAAVV